MLKNAECAAIIQVIGAGSGRSFDLEAARYGKVILMADADVDGAHIRCLLLTLFHRYMRPLLEDGRVYAAVPPLHRIEVINGGGRRTSFATPTPTPSSCGCSRDLEKKGRKVRCRRSATRASARWMPASCARPRWTPGSGPCAGSRRAAEAAEQVFDLLMGTEVAPRKDFLVSGRRGARPRPIDA